MYLNANLPFWRCYIRNSFLSGTSTPSISECVVFGVASIPGQVPLFHILTDCGAMRWRVPLNYLCAKPEAKICSLEQTHYWNCESDHIAVTVFDWLRDAKVFTRIAGETLPGKYVLTLDWTDEHWKTEATDTREHKCAHIIENDEGNFVCVPTNAILFHVEGFTTKLEWPEDWTWHEDRWHVHTKINDAYHYEAQRE